MSLASSTALDGAAGRARHPARLRVGLVLSVLLAVLSAIPAVSEIGLDGSAWDVLVIALAVVMPAIALATIVLTPLTWTGRRRYAVIVAVGQAVLILQLVIPVALFARGEVPGPVVVVASVSAGLSALAMWCVLSGARGR